MEPDISGWTMVGNLNDWTLLRFFLETARAGSIQAAAEPLGSSQPTVGRKIDLLESRIGTQLFIRTTAGIGLTEAGRSILKIAEEMETLAQSLAGATTKDSDLTGAVRFAGPDMIGFWLPERLVGFHNTHPGISLEVICRDDNSRPDPSRLQPDISAMYRRPADPSLKILWEGKLATTFVTSEQYVERHGLPRTLDGLLDHAFAAHSEHYREDGPWTRLSALLQRHPNIVYQSNSVLVLLEAMRWSLGITCLPVKGATKLRHHIFFDLEDFEFEIPFWLVCHQEMAGHSLIRAVVDQLRAEPSDTARSAVAAPFEDAMA